jgi:hypothetical protein
MLDKGILYEEGGSVVGHMFIHAEQSTRIWADHNECNPQPNV